jgi:predicted DNA-binding transcriptional regulator AlpA
VTSSFNDDDLLTDPEFAKYCRLSPGTPAVWRSENRHSVPYIKIGRSVRYRFGDVKKWLKSREKGGGENV